MTLDEVYDQAIVPAYGLLPPAMRSDEATTMLLAIGLQESRFLHRRQIGGPAMGFWQFETAGVRGVLNHRATKEHARVVCHACNLPPLTLSVYYALPEDDRLAGAFARLLLWSDAQALPVLGDEDGAWAYYLRNWRPGRPHLKTWSELYQTALNFVLR